MPGRSNDYFILMNNEQWLSFKRLAGNVLLFEIYEGDPFPQKHDWSWSRVSMLWCIVNAMNSTSYAKAHEETLLKLGNQQYTYSLIGDIHSE